MKQKIPLITLSLKRRLWGIIIIVMGFLTYSVLGDIIPRYWENIGLNPTDKNILGVGGIVILLICISGLALNDKLTSMIIKEELTGLYSKNYTKWRGQV